jgi:hypothetical protein
LESPCGPWVALPIVVTALANLKGVSIEYTKFILGLARTLFKGSVVSRVNSIVLRMQVSLLVVLYCPWSEYTAVYRTRAMAIGDRRLLGAPTTNFDRELEGSLVDRLFN